MTIGTLQAPNPCCAAQASIKLPLPGQFSWRLREIFWRRRAAAGPADAGIGRDMRRTLDQLDDLRTGLLANQPPM